MQTTPEVDIFDLPDDQVMNMTAPPPGAASVEQPVDQNIVDEQKPEDQSAEKPLDQQEQQEEATPKEGEQQEQKPADEPNPLSAADDKVDDKPADQKKPDEGKKPDEAAKTEEAKKPEEAAKPEDQAAKPDTTKEAPAQTELAAMSLEQKAQAFDSLTEFKANGKVIKLNSPEEVLRLVQMGANYTKKLQQLQPMMRLHKMLENNKLLDESELSYLIDLHQKKPEAIQKLLADSKFDPLTVDAEKAAQYKPSDHAVSDTEVQFDQVLQEVEASETGKELLTEITTKWDKESQRALFRKPELLTAINTQKSLGFYKVICDEVERRKLLGDLQGVPFLAAYEKVGLELNASGKLAPPAQVVKQKQEPEPQKREPVEVRTAAPASSVKNADKAAAASAPKTSPVPVKKVEENYLDMPDSQFLQSLNGRL